MYFPFFSCQNHPCMTTFKLSNNLEPFTNILTVDRKYLWGPEEIISIFLIRDSISIFRCCSNWIVSIGSILFVDWITIFSQFTYFRFYQILGILVPGSLSISSTLAPFDYLRWGSYSFLPDTKLLALASKSSPQYSKSMPCKSLIWSHHSPFKILNDTVSPTL